MNRKSFLGILASVVLLLAAGPLHSVGAAAKGKHDDAAGSVYTMTNGQGGNEIMMFDRASDGGLTPAGSVPTGGFGSGGGVDPLGSQGSLVLSDNNRWLLAVNAGSNDISVFRVSKSGLELTDLIASGGNYPTSVAVYQDLVYVLNADLPNAGAASNIAGFMLDHRGHLAPIASSTRSLPAGLHSQVGFDPRGEALVVTDRTSQTLLVYEVDRHGMPAAAPVVNPSAGPGPFAFVFREPRTLLVAEVGDNAVSSYELKKDGALKLLTPSVPNGQAATCWITDVKGRYAYTANPGKMSLSSFRIGQGKKDLELLAGVAGMGIAPLDLATAENGRFLYALDPGLGGIDLFRVEHDGGLIDIGPLPAGLPPYAQGLAAR
jgi:6-phosphogluconolactonase